MASATKPLPTRNIMVIKQDIARRKLDKENNRVAQKEVKPLPAVQWCLGVVLLEKCKRRRTKKSGVKEVWGKGNLGQRGSLKEIT
eukprot:CAMPEP_0194211574 /NCGR_PEP_ID=MMETSP0156-20130528/10674_1 /TAXON_ID=33649 /ORGANISM="Thalassionema nitzschioides, Strain L26-B" /LENGTH=84 /DNA_ID=CAMNT_0038939169 /DNA_START=22 /DNA_END=276 /DNA_ORIENTATION=+